VRRRTWERPRWCCHWSGSCARSSSFRRWPNAYVGGDAATQTAVAAAWTAQHQFGGALLGEHLGQLLVIAWSVTVSILIVRTGVLARWVGWAGLVASVLYLLNQGDTLATAVPDFPVWDLGGLLGSSLWGVWVLVLGVTLLARSSSPRRDQRG